MAVQYDAFVSYSAKDEQFVAWLCGCLKEAGLSTFRFDAVLEGGRKLDNSTRLIVESCRWLVTIVSPTYLSGCWPTFEALRLSAAAAVAEQRFMPIWLKYVAESELLDGAPAVAIGRMAEKLKAVRAHFPASREKLQDYPNFRLWEAGNAQLEMAKLLNCFRAGLSNDLTLPPLQITHSYSGSVGPMQFDVPPHIVWRSQVGHEASLTSPMVMGGDVFLGSAGPKWGLSNPDPIIRCFDAATGELRWFAAVPADTTVSGFYGQFVVTGSGDGSVRAFRASDGRLLWRTELPAEAIIAAVKLPSKISDDKVADLAPAEALCCVSEAGEIYILELKTGAVMQSVQLGAPLLAPPLVCSSEELSEAVSKPHADGFLVFASATGALIRVPVADGVVGEPVSRSFEAIATAADNGDEHYVFSSTPVRDGNRLVVAAWAENDPNPPLVMADFWSLGEIWRGTDPQGIGGGAFGSLRSTPLLMNGEAIFAASYSDGLTFVSLASGQVVAHLRLGTGDFDQWPCVTGGDGFAFVARHDGYLHCVNTILRRRVWSIFVGAWDRAGLCESRDAGDAWPIVATPAFDGSRLYVCSSDGWLYCLANVTELDVAD